MRMGVVDECPGARRRHVCHERLAGGNMLHGALRRAAQSRYTVVVALNFNAMPMDGGGLAEFVMHGDGGAFPTRHDQRRANRSNFFADALEIETWPTRHI